MFFIPYIANGITFLRIVFAVAMLVVVPFSAAFWVCYLCGGLSDVLDGLAARRFNAQSDAGAKIDSIADAVFALAIAVVAMRSLPLPVWLWVCVGSVALIRFVSYGVGVYKYHTFAPLHTDLNKVTGALIFAFPALYGALGFVAAGILVCAAAVLSSLEELAITVTAKNLNRNCKGILTQHRTKSHEAGRKVR